MAEAIRIKLQDLTTGEDLTPDDPAEVDPDMTAEELLKALVEQKAIRLPEEHIYQSGSVKIHNKSNGNELSAGQSLADIGTKDGDVLGLAYTAVHGR